MDDLYALDGGRAATKWRKNRRKRMAIITKQRTRRLAQMERETRYDQSQQIKRARANAKSAKNRRLASRKAKVRDMERADKAKWLKARKADGYTPGLPYKDLRGKRFGLLIVVKPGGHRPSGAKKWWVRCDCGSPLKEVSGTTLKQGSQRSCGCYGRDNLREPWHSPRYYRTQAARERAKARDEAKPLSAKLMKLRRLFKEGSQEAKLISAARNIIVCLEVATGVKKRRKEWKTARYANALKYIARPKAPKPIKLAIRR